MQYRILESLKYLDSSQRIEANTINSLKRLSPKSIEMLIAKGRIVSVIAPPLAVLPGFEVKAAGYAEQGIKDVNDMTGDEPDFDEVIKWSLPSEDDDYMTTPIGKPVYELSEDAYELSEAEDDDMEQIDALVDSIS